MKITAHSHLFLLAPGDIHVWIFKLDRPRRDYPALINHLSEEEIARSNHYRYNRDRQMFITRRAILRQLLGRYCGLDPAEISYHISPTGKLTLESQPLSFNLSHSGNRMAFAFTLEKQVGVDIEQIRPMPDLIRLVETWFSPQEQASLLDLAPAFQLEAFYHIWTQKEAYLKARGEGLAIPLKDFSVSADPDQPGKLLAVQNPPEDARRWKMTTSIPGSGWRVAVCVRSEADIHAIWYAPEMAEFLSWG